MAEKSTTTMAEFMRLLGESEVLKPDEMQIARQLAEETRGCKMLARRLVAKRLLTRWQASQLLVGWHKLRLGNYRLRSQIGRGKYGRVFLADHIQMGRDVAIKTLSRRFTQRQEIVDRFLEDSREIAALDHRNILHVLDIDSGDGQYFMVMEYINGRDLRRLVEEEGPLPFPVVANYVRQAAAGLAHAHELKIAHGDVCPANVMVDENGSIKLLGFGVARLADSDQVSAELTEENSTNTAESRSPDQGGQAPFDANRDIDALGCTAYYLMTGSLPFESNGQLGENGESRDGPTDIVELRSDAPSALAAIFQKMMAKRPEDRYSSAEVVERALRDWLARGSGSQPGLVGDLQDDAFKWLPKGRDGKEGSVQRATDADVSADPDEPSERRPGFLNPRQLIPVIGLALVALVTLAFVAFWPRDHAPTAGDEQPVAATPKQPGTRPAISNPNREHGVRGLNGDDKARSDSVLGSKKEKPVGSNDGVKPDEKAPANPAGKQPDSKPPGKETSEKSTTSPPSKEKVDAKPEATGKPQKVEKPTPKKPPPPPPNPLRRLPEAIGLPRPGSGEEATDPNTEVTLGPLDIDQDALLAVKLLGPDTAITKGAHFEIVPAVSKGPHSWQFKMSDPDRGDSASQMIARLSLRDGQLKFGWNPPAREQPAAWHLINCVLRLSSAEHSHDLRLRTPEQSDPLTVNFKKPSYARCKLEALPDPKQIRLEIVALDEPFPEAYTLNPAHPVAAGNANISIKLGEKVQGQILLLKVEGDFSPVFRLKCTPYFQLDPENEPKILNRRNFQEAEHRVTKNQLGCLGESQRRRAVAQNMPKNNPNKRRADQELRVAERYLELAVELSEKFKSAQELVEAAADGAHVHFRLFYLADDCEVDLMRTQSDG